MGPPARATPRATASRIRRRSAETRASRSAPTTTGDIFASARPRTTRPARWRCPSPLAAALVDRRRPVPLREPGRDSRRDHRASYEEALGAVAAGRRTGVVSRLVLDSLGHDLHPEGVAEIGDQLDDLGAATVSRHAADERAVDLHGIGRQAL